MTQIQKTRLKRYTLLAFIATTLYYVIEYLFKAKNVFVNRIYLWSPDGNDVIFGPEFIALPFKVFNYFDIPLITLCVAYYFFKKYTAHNNGESDTFFSWIMIGSLYGVLLAVSGFFGALISILMMGTLYGILHSSTPYSDDIAADIEIFVFKTEIKSFPVALIGTSVFYGMFYNLVFGIVIGSVSLLIAFLVFTVIYSFFRLISRYIRIGVRHSFDTSKKWLAGE